MIWLRRQAFRKKWITCDLPDSTNHKDLWAHTLPPLIYTWPGSRDRNKWILQKEWRHGKTRYPLPWKKEVKVLLGHSSVAVQSLSHVWLFATSWAAVCQALLSMGFPREDDWSGLSFPSPGDLPDSGIEPSSPTLQADSLPSEPPGKPSLPKLCFLWKYSKCFL